MRSLHAQLSAAIRDGRLRAGVQLPGTRDLAKAYGLSRNAVVLTYETLASEGLLQTRRGAGTFIADVRSQAADDANPDTERARASLHSRWLGRHAFGARTEGPTPFDFSIGIPDATLFPYDVWRRLTTRALRSQSREHPDYGQAAGSLALRQAIAAQISFTRAVSCEPDDIIVTAGTQQALDLIARLVVQGPDDVVAVEDPGYPPVRIAFELAGARVVPVEVDSEGMRVDLVPEKARVVCVTPSHEYPLGSQLSARRRAALLAFAHERHAVIVEDDYDGEFRFSGRPLEALKTLDRSDSVFYIGTFSKSLSPSIRLGYIVAPRWARQALTFVKQTADWHSPLLMQTVLADFIREGHFLRHLRRMRRVYERRGELLAASLRRHLHGRVEPFAPAGGLHLVALCEPGTDVDEIARRCVRGGVVVRSITDCWFDRRRWPMLGLGYGKLQEADIDAAVLKLRDLGFRS